MATKTLTNLAVLLLAISQVVYIATARELSPPGNPMTESSLLVTSISGPSGDSPPSGFEALHGPSATEAKVLLDAPNIPVPSSPPIQGKKSAMAASLLVTSVSGPSSDVAKGPSSTEEKILLDAPNIPVPSSPPLQGKKSMLGSRGA